MTGIQQATKKGSKNLLKHTHTTRSHTLIQIPLCAMKTCLQTFMCECVEDLNKAICAMKTCLQTVKCVTVEVLNNVS